MASQEGVLNIHQALAKVAGELPAIGKDQSASQAQGGYAYRGIEQITRHVQGLFAQYGVVVVPAVQHLETRDILVSNKPWTDTILHVKYTLIGPDGSSVDAVTVGIGRDSADKGANKAMTQAFKYLLLQMLCISDRNDDTDGQTHEADARSEHPHAGRVRELFADIKRLSSDSQTELKVWAKGRKVSGPELLGDETWLMHVEAWVAEELDRTARGTQTELVPS